MRLVFVRHAIAEDREIYARGHKDDAGRPLTPEGRGKMERGAVGLRALVPELDVVASSPYRRAVDTAEIIARAYGSLHTERVPALAPGQSVDAFLNWLVDQRSRGTLAVVGHEPNLSQIICTLLAGTNGPFLELRKGAACLLDLPGPVNRGAATLDWLLGPKHLRRLAADRD